MNIDSGVIYGIALVAAVLSPIITALINNHHEIKMHKLKFYEQHRAEVLENYIRNTGSVISSPSQETITAYGQSFGEIFLYVPNVLWDDLKSLHNQIIRYDWEAAQPFFAILCQALSESHPRGKNK